jgi:murein DD-endopeptidase MepM/ murein hydrolase activator NlpD
VSLLAASLLHLAAEAAGPAPAALVAPVARACVTSPFGTRQPPGPHALGYHYGIDLRAPAGGAVRAVAAGQVVSIHRRGPGGLEVLVRHDGFVAVYAHLGSVTPALAMGQTRLAAGDRIGVVGRSGVTYGTHLYFEILVRGRPVDPAPFLGVQRCG